MESGEECDGLDLNGTSCEANGLQDGTVVCRADCTPDYTGCGFCGDGALGSSEECEGENLTGETCESQGFEGGALQCSGCLLDSSDCYRCGDGMLNGPDEGCDGSVPPGLTCEGLGFAGGSLSCDASCTIDTQGCLDLSPYSLSFDGIDDIVNCGPLALGLPLANHTLEMWIKAASTGTSLIPWGTIIHKWSCDCSSRTLVLAFAEPNYYYETQLGPTCADEQINSPPLGFAMWHHIAFTFGATPLDRHVYLDGYDLNPMGCPACTIAGPLQASPWSVLLGNSDGSCPEFGAFEGLVDEIRLWNYARAVAELDSARYTSLSGSEPGLVAYWPLDEGTGDLTLEVVSSTLCVLGATAGPDSGDPVWTSDTPF